MEKNIKIGKTPIIEGGLLYVEALNSVSSNDKGAVISFSKGDTYEIVDIGGQILALAPRNEKAFALVNYAPDWYDEFEYCEWPKPNYEVSSTEEGIEFYILFDYERDSWIILTVE